jgi:uncharacterized protein YecE (DUF72 family)
MLHVGCAGFPVPATRYLKEFLLEEVADTLLGVPGPALLRRWRREAPAGFVFTAVAPRELGPENFKPSPAADAAWEAFLPVVRELDARAIVVTSSADTPWSKTVRQAARQCFEKLPAERLPPLVWEPSALWSLKDCEAAVKDLPVVVARDPLKHPPVGRCARAYFRLPGPAGHKSRYEDPALEQVAQTVRASQAQELFVVFTNVDMYADAKRLRKILEA